MEGGEKLGWLKMEGERAGQRLTPSHIEKKTLFRQKRIIIK